MGYWEDLARVSGIGLAGGPAQVAEEEQTPSIAARGLAAIARPLGFINRMEYQAFYGRGGLGRRISQAWNPATPGIGRGLTQEWEPTSWLGKAGKWVVATAADIALDPLSYVGGWALKGAGTAARKAAQVAGRRAAVEIAEKVGTAGIHGVSAGLEESAAKMALLAAYRGRIPYEEIGQIAANKADETALQVAAHKGILAFKGAPKTSINWGFGERAIPLVGRQKWAATVGKVKAPFAKSPVYQGLRTAFDQYYSAPGELSESGARLLGQEAQSFGRMPARLRAQQQVYGAAHFAGIPDEFLKDATALHVAYNASPDEKLVMAQHMEAEIRKHAKGVPDDILEDRITAATERIFETPESILWDMETRGASPELRRRIIDDASRFVPNANEELHRVNAPITLGRTLDGLQDMGRISLGKEAIVRGVASGEIPLDEARNLGLSAGDVKMLRRGGPPPPAMEFGGVGTGQPLAEGWADAKIAQLGYDAKLEKVAKKLGIVYEEKGISRHFNGLEALLQPGEVMPVTGAEWIRYMGRLPLNEFRARYAEVIERHVNSTPIAITQRIAPELAADIQAAYKGAANGYQMYLSKADALRDLADGRITSSQLPNNLFSPEEIAAARDTLQQVVGKQSGQVLVQPPIVYHDVLVPAGPPKEIWTKGVGRVEQLPRLQRERYRLLSSRAKKLQAGKTFPDNMAAQLQDVERKIIEARSGYGRGIATPIKKGREMGPRPGIYISPSFGLGRGVPVAAKDVAALPSDLREVLYQELHQAIGSDPALADAQRILISKPIEAKLVEATAKAPKTVEQLSRPGVRPYYLHGQSLATMGRQMRRRTGQAKADYFETKAWEHPLRTNDKADMLDAIAADLRARAAEFKDGINDAMAVPLETKAQSIANKAAKMRPDLNIRNVMINRYAEDVVNNASNAYFQDFRKWGKTDAQVKGNPNWFSLTGELASRLELKGLMFPKEAMQVLERVLPLTKLTQDEQALKSLGGVWDAVTGLWKAGTVAGLTGPRWIQLQAVGNVLNAWLGGLRNPERWGQAMLGEALQMAPEGIRGVLAEGIPRTWQQRFMEGAVHTWIGKLEQVVPTTEGPMSLTKVIDLADQLLPPRLFQVEEELLGGGVRKASRLAKFNPLSQRFGWYQAMYSPSNWLDRTAQRALFIDRFYKGDAPTQAAEHVKEFLFDYGGLTKSERWLRRYMFPFFTWTRYNSALQMKTLLRSPVQIAAPLKAVANMEMLAPAYDPRLKPVWMGEGLGIRVPGSWPPRYYEPNVPLTDIARVMSLRQGLSNIHPVWQLPIKMGIGDPFSGRKMGFMEAVGSVMPWYSTPARILASPPGGRTPEQKIQGYLTPVAEFPVNLRKETKRMRKELRAERSRKGASLSP